MLLHALALHEDISTNMETYGLTTGRMILKICSDHTITNISGKMTMMMDLEL